MNSCITPDTPLENMGFGPLTILRTYAYYDRPLIFLARSAILGPLLFTLTDFHDAHDAHNAVWLVLPVTSQGLHDLEMQRVTLRHALTHSELGWLYRVAIEHSPNSPDPLPTIVRTPAEDDLPPESSWLTPLRRKAPC